ncbi:hypothetical protein H6764_00035 [Candidatus Nomurabacteria bacterium]|nr:hypothetical protein [Candidatus Nomurabacteria bacterium]
MILNPKLLKANLYRIVAGLTLLALTGFICILLPYGYGDGNQGEIIPIHNRLEDPNYLKNDKFVNQQMEYNVRSNFAYVMYAANHITPKPIGYPEIYFGFFFITTFLTFLGILKISQVLVRDKWLALSVTIIYSMLPNISIGGVSLITSHLLPSSFAVVLIIWGLYFFLTERHYKMVIFLALSLYMHVLVGLLASAVILFAYLVVNYKKHLLDVVKTSFLWLLITFPALLPQFLNASESFGGDSKQLAYIIGFFRNPHHYIPSTWDLHATVVFFIIEVLSVVLLCFFFREKRREIFNKLALIFVALNIMYFCGYFFVEVITLTPFVKLQLFRISVMTDLLSKLIIIVSSVIMIKKMLNRANLSMKKRKYTLTIVIFAISAISTGIKVPSLNSHINVYPVTASSNRAAYQWVAENTSPDDVFLAPIGERNIRLQMNRAVAANFKQFVFKDNQVIEWYEEIKDFCGMEEPNCRGWACAEYCDSKFSAYSEEQLLTLGKKYHAEYLITTNPNIHKFDLVYKDTKYSIYKLNYE